MVPVHDACTDVVLKKYAENTTLKRLRKGSSGIPLLPTCHMILLSMSQEFAPKKKPFVVIPEL